jgi:NhaP-type Na+/H+ or K+/H+ antiporter
MAAEHTAPAEDIILILMILFLVGTIALSITSRYLKSVPYTVFLLIIGIVIAVVDHYSDESSVLKLSLQQLISIPPKLIIFIFIPSLLFGEAMRIKYYTVKSIAVTCILLVGPGCLAGAYAMAALCYVSLPYEFSWNICCAIGAILCATDPVSVIAVMRKANCSPGLTAVIVGEALINDCKGFIHTSLALRV